MRTPAAAASSAAWRAVEWRVSAARSASSSQEGRLVHEQVGLEGHQPRHLAGRRVAGEDEAPPPSRLAHHLVGPHAADGLAVLQPPEVRPRGHAKRPGALGVEGTRARILDEGVAERGHAVVGRVGGDPVAVALELVVGLELDQLERERHPAHDRPQGCEQAAQPRRSVDGERPFALPQRERLEHPGQAEHVVGVEVGDEDLLQLDQADRADELALGALAAVEQQPVAAAPHQRGGQAAAGAGG